MSNEVIKTMKNRVSLRTYDDRMITEEDLDQILECAAAAPTAGKQQLYSIIVIKDQETKEKLSKSCDNQPFIAKAPVLLLFVADQYKWFEYYRLKGVKEYAEKQGMKFEAPQESDLLLACEDTMAAAENAVIAAESLGIGSCYIGDIMENYEYHKELFHLPDWTFPLALLCFGYYKEGYKRNIRARYDRKYVVFDETYKTLSKEEYEDMYRDEEKLFRPDNPYHGENFAQMFYGRKTGAAFSREMARSVRVAMKNWDGRYL